GMWDNLGRVVAEYSHLRKLAVSWDPSRITVSGREYIQEKSQPSLFFTAHYANWEIAALAIMREELPLMQVYRSAENPLVNHMIRRAQRQVGDTLIPSGRAGAKQLLEALRQKVAVLMLLDQRKKNGLPIPFFGHPALTAPAIGRLALQHKCLLIPVQVLRLGRTSQFEVRFFPPLVLPQQGSSQERLLALMTAVNQHIEAWVRERPDLWFWVHNRWKLS
ncbi:MAG: lysophospholipid acyltransferase family protein, partial [Holosporales bacterium]|nr:lysophospholipid acyltransferase family protein [Holosporales bacterium]